MRYFVLDAKDRQVVVLGMNPRIEKDFERERTELIHTMMVNNERYNFCKFQQPLTARALVKYPDLYEKFMEESDKVKEENNL